MGYRRDIWPLALLAALTCGLLSCDPGESWHFNRDGICPNGTEPDLMRDVNNCGSCYHVCDLTGAAKHACVAGICGATACEPGYFDRDGVPDNGCECRGETIDTCRSCRSYETILDGIDDNCNGETDEGAGVPLSRVHCGAIGASCLLPPGAKDVRCELQVCAVGDPSCGTCEAKPGPDGRVHCGLCVAIEPGTVPVEAPEECFDAIDNDGNGIIDDGPHCEALLANAARPECNWKAPSAECPPNPVFIERTGDPLGALRVDLTTDVHIDRFEVTRAQYAVFARARGDCSPRPGADGEMNSDARCRVEPWHAKLPVAGVSWCEAYEYCQWAGKRLPTLAEWHRAATADYAGAGDPLDAQSMAETGRDPCYTDDPPALGACNADGPQPVDMWGGTAYIGAAGYSIGLLEALGIFHLTGNVAEWLFDEQVDACAVRDDGRMALTGMNCTDPDRPVQQLPLLDWTYTTRENSPAPRMVCGGGWTGVEDAFRLGEHQFAHPGVKAEHYGFRCGRSRLPRPEFAATAAYDSTLESRIYADCEAPPLGPVIPRSGQLHTAIAIDACVAIDRAGQDMRRLDDIMGELIASGAIRWMLVHDRGLKPEHITLSSVFDAGDEQFHLAGDARRITEATAEPDCLLTDCPQATLVGDGPITLARWNQRSLTAFAAEVVGLDLAPHRPPCSLRSDAPIVARVELEFGEDALPAIGVNGAVDGRQLAALLTCVDRGDDGRCVRWRAPLEVGFTPL